MPPRDSNGRFKKIGDGSDANTDIEKKEQVRIDNPPLQNIPHLFNRGNFGYLLMMLLWVVWMFPPGNYIQIMPVTSVCRNDCYKCGIFDIITINCSKCRQCIISILQALG
jgi:hypothetical protein